MQVRAFERYIPLITDDCTTWKGGEHTLLKYIAVQKPTIAVSKPDSQPTVQRGPLHLCVNDDFNG